MFDPRQQSRQLQQRLWEEPPTQRATIPFKRTFWSLWIQETGGRVSTTGSGEPASRAHRTASSMRFTYGNHQVLFRSNLSTEKSGTDLGSVVRREPDGDTPLVVTAFAPRADCVFVDRVDLIRCEISALQSLCSALYHTELKARLTENGGVGAGS